MPDQASRAAAEAMAARCGSRVEVLGLRTETGQVFANPDGTGTVEEYAYPQRVRQAGGGWAPLDATLVVNADGSLSPRAATVDLHFSGGGAQRLVSAHKDGQDLGLSWPGQLPRPVVQGNVATYPEVMRGVDLVVTAHETGFGEVLVVKDRAAAADPGLREIAFGLSGDLRPAEPMMWDSSTRAAPGARAASGPQGPAQGARSAPIASSEVNGRLTLKPSASLLDDPNAVFPLFLDPTVNYSHWTMINSQYTSQSYWAYDRTDCPTGFSTDCAKVGQAYGLTMDYRSAFDFATSGFKGKQITSAKFTIDLLWSAYGTNSVTELHTTGAIGSGTTWANHASTWSGVIASVSNQDHATSTRKLTEISGGSLQSTIQTIANGSATVTTWGLKAATETSDSGWKKFDAKTAKLVIGTNTVPDVPDTLTVDGKSCVSGSNRPYVATATPVLKSRVVDPDGNSMTDYFAWAKWNGSSYVDVGSGNQTSVASGGYGQVTPAALEDDAQYTFRSQAKDASLTSAWTSSPGNCEFVVDLTNPVTPTVTPDVYTEGCVSCGSVGQTGHFTFASSADVASYKWGFTSPSTTAVSAVPLGSSVSVDWTPTTGGAQTLYVQAIDRAGRTATKTFQFYVAPPSNAVARWKLNDAAGSATLADDTGNGRTATVQGGTLGAPGRLVPGLDGMSRSAMSFNGSSDSATRADLIDTSKSFTVSAWVKLNSKTSGVDQTVLSNQGSWWSSFYLQYDGSLDRWVLEIPSSDAQTPTPTWWDAKSTTIPQVGVWTHLAGVYDNAAHTASIYVNGVLEGTSTNVTAVDVTGNLQLGRSGSTWLNGSASEIQLWGRVLQAGEVFDLSDPIKVGRVADYHMDEVGPGPAFDSSGMAHDLTFYNGASIPASGAGQTGTGLRLDGVDDYVAPSEAVVYTDQSFTVSSWVRVTGANAYQSFVVQRSDGTNPGFDLYYGQAEAQYKFKIFASASDTSGTDATLAATAATTPGTYHHLVGVFDAGKREIRLYLDGALKSTVAMNAAWQPWNATGALHIGHSQSGAGSASHMGGDTDEVRVYQGVVADVTRIP